MKKLKEIFKSLNIWYKSLTIAMSPIIGGLAIFSAIEALYNYNIATKLLNPYSPHSYIYIVFVCLFIFIGNVLIYFKKLSFSESNKATIDNITASDIDAVGIMSESDKATIDAMSDAFPKQEFREFIDELLDSRRASTNRLEDYVMNIRRFSEPNYSISNETVETVKNNFLHSLVEFIDFTNNHFDLSKYPNHIIFKGHMTENYISPDTSHEEIAENYQDTVEKLINNWQEFLVVLKEEYPNYVWKEQRECKNS